MKSAIHYFITFSILLACMACDQKNNITPDEAKSIAKEAYIYSFPMVMGYKAMNAYILDKNNPEYKGPFNYMACDARLLTPDDKAIVTPNSDTPYCMVWVDIRKEPVIFTVPEMEPERFYHFQLVDLFTHNFDYIGTLSTGNGAGKFMVATAGWSGEASEGISGIIRCETPLFFVVVRTQLFGPEDLPAVQKIQEAYTLQTLSEYQGGNPVTKAEVIDIPEWKEGDQFTPAIFTYADAMLDMTEPVEEEKALMQDFAKLGIGRNLTFSMADFDPEVQTAIEEGVKEGFAEIEGFIKTLNSDPLSSTKIFGTREFLNESAQENFGLNDFYLLRATAAHMGLYGNSGFEAIYPTYLMDADGTPFDASANKYTLTFASGELPPVKSFWSLTMYDGKTQLMIHNPLDRYLLNSSMLRDFVYGEDGSLTFYIQKDSPGKELEANWLPAPDGPFYAVLRLYGPEEEALTGAWTNPPLAKMN